MRYYPPPEPAICLKCGGKIPQKDIGRRSNGRSVSCPHSIVIGPGHKPMWIPDKEKHVCQSQIDKKAIMAEKRRLRLIAGPLVEAFIKKFTKRKKK